MRACLDGEAAISFATPGHPAKLERDRIYNVLADAIVTAHNDVTNVNVAALVADASG